MREILFRGFARKANGSKTIEINGEKIRGQWIYWNVYGDLVNKGNTKIEWFKFCLPDGRPHDLNTVVSVAAFGLLVKETVEQYTGLTDKNGRKIFEDDIVVFECHGMGVLVHRGAVIFKDGCFGVAYDFYGLRFHRFGEVNKWQDMGASGTTTYTYKVIGNIHDNPELLKEVKE